MFEEVCVYLSVYMNIYQENIPFQIYMEKL